jgi:phosphohistidine swiveling domain-containing protein
VADGEVSWAAFVDKYGHLRPGTYDITSPCYASAPEEYLRPVVEAARANDGSRRDEGGTTPASPWDARSGTRVAAELRALGLGVDLDAFEQFLRTAIEGRELSKFIFTRGVSAALEAISELGEAHGITRDELAHVRVQDLFALRGAGTAPTRELLQPLIRAGREAFDVTQACCLPGQVFAQEDFACFEQLRASPNFVTRRKVRGRVAAISQKTCPETDLAGRIVLTPNADPGFDWIFSRGIAGLITLYGGANSHMAIRAAEFQLPAATGIGELLYEKISQSDMVELDCAGQKVRIVR